MVIHNYSTSEEYRRVEAGSRCSMNAGGYPGHGYLHELDREDQPTEKLQALAAFMASKAEIDTILARVTALA
jgi:hypothetical protein